MLYQILAFTIHIKKSYKNQKFKTSAATWNGGFELPDGLYSISDIHNDFKCILKSMGKR